MTTQGGKRVNEVENRSKEIIKMNKVRKNIFEVNKTSVACGTVSDDLTT